MLTLYSDNYAHTVLRYTKTRQDDLKNPPPPHVNKNATARRDNSEEPQSSEISKHGMEGVEKFVYMFVKEEQTVPCFLVHCSLEKRVVFWRVWESGSLSERARRNIFFSDKINKLIIQY